MTDYGPLLTIRDLSKTYPNGTRALDGVTLEIPTGLFGLLGPNGAGKSTLMRTVAALQQPDSGAIRFDGVDILQSPKAIRECLGYLPQEFGVYPKISALDLLHHLAVLKGLTDSKARREQVDALLQQTNLYPVRKKAVGSFSGGMRQRFGIAQALLGDPHLIIVDEPTAGLDPEERHRFHNLLGEIGENVVVVLSTHIVEDVRDLCAAMAILVDGRVRLVGSPSELVDRLDGKVWLTTVAKRQLAKMSSRHTVLSERFVGGGRRVRVFSESPPGPGFEPARPTLEDVYFSVLREEV